MKQSLSKMLYINGIRTIRELSNPHIDICLLLITILKMQMTKGFVLNTRYTFGVKGKLSESPARASGALPNRILLIHALS